MKKKLEEQASKFRHEAAPSEHENQSYNVSHISAHEAFIRSIADNVAGMISYWTDELRCAFANQEYEKWFGRTKEQMLGMRLQELLGEELFLKNEPYIKGALKGERQQFERELTQGNGEKRHTFAQYIPHKVNDKVMGFIVLITDITKIKQAELELREHKERLVRDNSLLEKSQSIARIGGFELDLRTNELYWTAESYRIHDTSPENFKPTVEATMGYLLPESKKIASEAFEKIIKEGKSFDVCLETYTNKGRKILVRTTCVATMEEGKTIKLTGIFQDITEQKKEEEKLLISNTRLQVATDAAKIGIWDRDLINGISIWDETMLLLHGCANQNVNTNDFKALINLVHSDDRKRVFEVYERAIKGKGGPLLNLEYRVHWGDGSIHFLKANAKIMRDTNGTAIRIIGCVMDVTETRINERNLKASENRLRAIIENEPECVKILNKQGELIDMNAAGLAMLNATSLEQVKAYQLINFIAPEHQHEFKHVHEQVFKGNNASLVFRITSFKDEVRWLETHAVPLRNEENEVEFLLGITRDVTAQKQAQKQLEDSEAKYKLLYESNLVPIVVFESKTYRFLSVNNAFLEKYGYTLEEILKMSILDIRPESERERTKAVIDVKYDTVAHLGVVIHKKKNGEIMHVDIRRRDIIFEGKEAKLVVITDVTEQKQAEQEILKLNGDLENKVIERTKELAQANKELALQNEEIVKQSSELIIARKRAEESDRLKSAFLANMSHEIRTPMNGILGFAEILKRPNLTIEKQRGYISIIEKSGERMLNIINNIIDISKIESGAMSLSLSKTDINEQLEFLYSFFKEEAEKKGIMLSLTEKLPEEKSRIETDVEKVYAVLTNLIKNAIKNTSSGSIQLGCTIDPGEYSVDHLGESRILKFYVKDTGKGIPEDKLNLIFERFSQADVTPHSEGAGLGLTISKSFVEMMDGKIWVESEPEKGSIFYFTIPFKTI